MGSFQICPLPCKWCLIRSSNASVHLKIRPPEPRVQHMRQCLLKSIWWMNIILLNNESVWYKDWLKNKCRSQWPIVHDPVILLYVLKSVSWMNVILWDNESVWCNDWPDNKCKSQWPTLHGPVIFSYYAHLKSSDFAFLYTNAKNETFVCLLSTYPIR